MSQILPSSFLKIGRPRSMMGPLLAALCTLAATNVGQAQSLDDAEQLLRKFEGQIDQLLAKPQPPLFQRHLKSLRAMARSQFSVLSLEQGSYLRRPLADHIKEYHGYLQKIRQGLEGDAANPNCYLKDGNRPLVLARVANRRHAPALHGGFTAELGPQSNLSAVRRTSRHRTGSPHGVSEIRPRAAMRRPRKAPKIRSSG